MSDSFETPWTAARQVPLSLEFLMQEYWRELPFPFLGDLTEPQSPALRVDSLPSELPGNPYCPLDIAVSMTTRDYM